MIKELEEKFTGKGQVKGFLFTQVKKTEFGYIYKVLDGGNLRYEVFKRKINSRFSCISYPSNNSFGIWAFTTICILKANTILESFDKFEEVKND